MAMAHHDNDDELLRSRAEGWRSFAHLLGWAIQYKAAGRL